MIKFKKNLVLLASMLLLASPLAACVKNNDPKPSSETSQSSSGSEATFIDYAHNGSAVLNLDYKNRDFMVDGVGEVSLHMTIDGDTAHFYPKVGHTDTILKARFYGIDTPESTGSVQPWGKKASNFTKQKLLNARDHGTIVVSSPASTYQAPEYDSTGSRFLSLVWINETKRNCELNELTLLNLWIVQEGYSWAKNVNQVPQYADIFQDAQDQAEKFGLNLWSGDDPDFNYGDYSTVSLLEIKKEIAKSIADATHENSFTNQKVRFTGTVSGYADNTLYVQEYYPVDDDDPSKGGEYAGINVYTGMSSINTKYTKVGTYLEIVGLALDSENFGFQITDTAAHWPASDSQDPNDCKVLIKAEDNTDEHKLKTFTYTAAELEAIASSNNLENLYCRTKVSDNLVCERAYVSTSGDTTLYFKDVSYTVYIPFQYYGDLENQSDIWNTSDRFVGKTFNVEGTYSWHRTSSGKVVYQIVPTASSDVLCTNLHGTLPNDRLSVSEANEIAVGLNGAANEKTAITYYVEGKVKSLDNANTSTTGESKYASLVLTDGTKDLVLYKLGVSDDKISEWFGENGSLKVGSTVRAKGLIQNYTGSYQLVSGSILEVYPKGALIEEPLTVEEALDAIAALSDDNNHPNTRYYVRGTISAIAAVEGSAKYNITLAGASLTLDIVEARLRTGISIDDLTVGKEILVSGRLYKNGSDLQLSGACYVESIYE